MENFFCSGLTMIQECHQQYRHAPEDYQITVRFATIPVYESQGTNVVMAMEKIGLPRSLYGLLQIDPSPEFYGNKNLDGERSSDYSHHLHRDFNRTS